MGLPRWRDISPEAKEAIPKVDRTAPARSPIRRRNATRQPRTLRDGAPQFQALEDFIAGRLRQAEAARPRIRFESQQHSRPPPAADASPAPPPVPESRNYAAQGSDDAREDQPDQVTQALRLAQAFLQRPLDDTTPTAAYTPNFAPAAAARNPGAGLDRSSDRAPSGSPLEAGTPHFDHVEDGDGDHSREVANMPPLRRMGRRRITHLPLPSSSLRESWSPATTLDGLGDRERSVSPMVDHWDTFLSTVAPDPLAPSADSSFTSAAASASFSNSNPSSRAGSSNSASSSRTHLTVPSQQESLPGEPMRICDTDDSSSASDSDEDEIDTVTFEPEGDRSNWSHRQVAEAAMLERSRHRLRQRQRELRALERLLRRARANPSRDAAGEDHDEVRRMARLVRHRVEMDRVLDRQEYEMTRRLDGPEVMGPESLRRTMDDAIASTNRPEETQGNDAQAGNSEQGQRQTWAEVRSNLHALRANLQESMRLLRETDES